MAQRQTSHKDKGTSTRDLDVGNSAIVETLPQQDACIKSQTALPGQTILTDNEDNGATSDTQEKINGHDICYEKIEHATEKHQGIPTLENPDHKGGTDEGHTA